MGLVRGNSVTRRETITLYDNNTSKELGKFGVEYKVFTQREVESLLDQIKELKQSELADKIVIAVFDLNHEDGTPFTKEEAIDDSAICLAMTETFWNTFRDTRITRAKQP